MRRNSLICLLTKVSGTGKQWLVLFSNEMKAENPSVSIVEPMAIANLLETSKQETLQMQLQLSAHFEIQHGVTCLPEIISFEESSLYRLGQSHSGVPV